VHPTTTTQRKKPNYILLIISVVFIVLAGMNYSRVLAHPPNPPDVLTLVICTFGFAFNLGVWLGGRR
jgi:hypothetical protein